MSALYTGIRRGCGRVVCVGFALWLATAAVRGSLGRLSGLVFSGGFFDKRIKRVQIFYSHGEVRHLIVVAAVLVSVSRCGEEFGLMLRVIYGIVDIVTVALTLGF
jgi:hypothetical protein